MRHPSCLSKMHVKDSREGEDSSNWKSISLVSKRYLVVYLQAHHRLRKGAQKLQQLITSRVGETGSVIKICDQAAAMGDSKANS